MLARQRRRLWAAAWAPISGLDRLPGTWLGLVTPAERRAGAARLALPRSGGRPDGTLGCRRRRADERDFSVRRTRLVGRRRPSSTGARSGGTSPRQCCRAFEGLHLDAGCGLALDPQVRAVVEATAARWRLPGAVLRWSRRSCGEWLRSLDLFWRVRSWNDLLALEPAARERALPFVVRWASGGAEASGVEVLRAYQATQAIRAATIAATSAYDVVLSPWHPWQPSPRSGRCRGDRRGPGHGAHRVHRAVQHVRAAGRDRARRSAGRRARGGRR